MKKILSLLLAAVLMLSLLAGCGGESGDKVKTITLAGEETKVKGGGAAFKGNLVKISSAGTYLVSGSLQGGQIVVNTSDSTAETIIILDGAEISNPDGPAILIEQAEGARIELAEGSANKLTSGTEGSTYDETASGAVIFSEDDLDIDGKGSLEIKGYINNGIGCKDDLDINEGTVSVYAVNNGIRASESIEFKGGTVSVEAGNDGLKTSSDVKEGKGYISFTGGSINIMSGGDGISAVTELTVDGGEITVNAQGDPMTKSCKAMKAGTVLSVNGGSLNLVSSDHALQSAGTVNLAGGSLTAQSEAERGISAEGEINISGGENSITSGSDGIKSLANINVSGGTTYINSASDGVQAGDKTVMEERKLSLTDGKLYISAYKKGVNADALEIGGGEIMLLQNDEHPGFDYLGTQTALSAPFAAAKGNNITVNTDSGAVSVSSGNACRYVFFSAPGLTAGNAYEVSNGIKTVTVTAA